MEGAYTRVAKIALVNALGAPALCDLLFGREALTSNFSRVHGRSFLVSSWATLHPRGITSRSVLPGFLSSVCGNWATVIADDSRLRLCRSCADTGYQSALFQIEALPNCPIHQEPLIDSCPNCHAPTPRYALCSRAFELPMQCTVCGVGYGRAWSGSADFSNWTGPCDLRPLQRLAYRLRAVQALKLDWLAATIEAGEPSGVLDVRQPKRVFLTLMALSGAAHDPNSVLTVRTSSCLPSISSMRTLDEEPRIAIYKSIRRQVVKRLKLQRLRKSFRFFKMFYQDNVNGTIVPKRPNCAPGLHALVLWVTRCEDSDWYLMNGTRTRPQKLDSVRFLVLRVRLLLWPGDVRVPDGLWAQYIWSCFLEDLYTAKQWNSLVAPLGNPLERADKTSTFAQSNRASFLAHLVDWMPRLSPFPLTTPRSIIPFTSRRGSASQQFGFVTVRRSDGSPHKGKRTAKSG